jgi:hypothetical protein
MPHQRGASGGPKGHDETIVLQKSNIRYTGRLEPGKLSSVNRALPLGWGKILRLLKNSIAGEKE